jgi:hypothetical protein
MTSTRKYTWGDQEAEDNSFDDFCQTYFNPSLDIELDRTYYYPKNNGVQFPFHNGTVCKIGGGKRFKLMYLRDIYSRTQMAADYAKAKNLDSEKFLDSSRHYNPYWILEKQQGITFYRDASN